MEYVDNILGNIVIKHEKSALYLKQDLTFTSDRSLASRFYLLKTGNSSIINGDRITVNVGNKTLVQGETSLMLVDRDEVPKDRNSMIITDGSDDPKAIAYGSTVFFIVDKDKKKGLKKDVSEKKLIGDDYGGISDINSFKFILEKADNDNGNVKTMARSISFVDANKGLIVMILLMILLVLSILAGK